jgi:hypothetical protein
MMNNMSQGLGSFNNMMPQNNMQQNPYGQQMNPQMMGQQVRSPEMFSEQLMNPMMPQMQDPLQGLQPMAEPEGFGVYGQSLSGFADGGAASSGGVPRETVIGGQPHMLAYINPEEEQMLYAAGGSGEPGPGGIPAFIPDDGNRGSSYAPRTSPRPRARPADLSSSMARASSQSAAELAYMARATRAAQQAAANTAAQRQAAVAAANKQAAESMSSVGVRSLGGQGGSALPDDNVTASSEPITLAQLAAARAAESNNQVDRQSGTQLADIMRRKDAAQRNAAANKQAANSFQGTGIAGLSGQGVPTDVPVDGTAPAVPLATVTNKEPNAAEKLAGYRKNTPNTFREFLANALTPGDQMKYVNGQLVYGDNHPNAGQPVPEDATNSFGLKVGMGNSVGNDNPGAGNFANSGEARAANQGGLPGIPGAIAGTLGKGMAFLGGIRPTDVEVGRGADGLQIFETGVRNSTGETGYFYVIDPMTGLVRNVKGANDSTSPLVDMSQMMDDASSNDSPAELAYVANLQAEQDAINNPVVDDPYSPTPLTRAGTGMGSNVGTIYDTGNTIVESGTNPFAQGNQVGALTFEELMRLNQQQNRIL